MYSNKEKTEFNSTIIRWQAAAHSLSNHRNCKPMLPRSDHNTKNRNNVCIPVVMQSFSLPKLKKNGFFFIISLSGLEDIECEALEREREIASDNFHLLLFSLA